MMPLGMANVGDVNIIKQINGRDDVRQHLAELGFVPGAEISVVSELGGNLILSVKESRIALDKTMAMRIMV
ncbi:MAG: FeoA family protein [Candidatus Limiplasma sp.]|jgi:ferrous iron transport protein A|nr:ferrous iron transport protein A [Clostridiales bacterium]MDY4062810.1 FeoA family protein [Candidatus Limiplasma sp.]